MASLALGLALGGVGNFLLPGIGGSLGFSIGAMIGSRLGHKAHQSPQLKDLRVQTSEYGTPIPIGYGTIRIAGWLEWAADKVPHKHKQGGKGGPKVTTTTYTDSFAIGLLETSFLDGDGVLVNNPIVGILRVWANGRLVWGGGSPADALPMTIYYGTEDQMPDPAWEADKGVGQVSGNRGKAYVVFTDLELAPYGDTIPNFTFEIVASGSIGLEYYALWPVDYDYPSNSSIYAHPYQLNGVDSSVPGQITLHRYRAGNAYGTEMGTSDNHAVYYDQSHYDLQGNLIGTEPRVTLSFSATGTPIVVDGSMNNGIAYVAWGQAGVDCSAYGASTDVELNTYAWLKDGEITYTPPVEIYCPAAFTSGGFPAVWQSQMQLGITGGLIFLNGNVYALGCTIPPISGKPCIRRYPAPDGSVYGPSPGRPAYDAEFLLEDYTVDGLTSSPGNLVIGSDGFIYCTVTASTAVPKGGVGTKLIKLDADLNFIADWYGDAFGPSGATPVGVASDYSSVEWHGYWISNHSTIPEYVGYNYAMYRMTPGTGGASGTFTLVDHIPAEGVLSSTSTLALNSPLIYIGNGRAAFRGGILTLGTGQITLGEVVSNIAQHVGYADDENDVDQLTDIVRGYCISQRTSGRAAIEALQPAYGFGATESNFANKFVKWGGEVSVIIPDEDLGARPSGSEPDDPLKRTQITDKDLPRRVEVIFLNVDMDYQEGMHYFDLPVRSDINTALSMALVFTDTEAKAVAENIGTNALVERNKFSFSLPRKYADLEPTDVIAINEQAIRIVSKDEQGYTHIAYEGISTRIGEWITAPFAPIVDYVPQAPPGSIKTDLLLLDTALASDTDFEYGFNVAVAGTTSASWPGAGLYKSIDGGASYDSIAAMVVADTFGSATSALGDFTGGNVLDEGNHFSVRLRPGSGDLSSTNSLGLLNGANLFALGTDDGYELAQFRTAILTDTSSGGSKTYQLSGFLRGRRGTEWATGTHASNDNFVLLPAHNQDGVPAEIGAERSYKAVTVGSTLSSATAVPFTNTGVALKEYAPVLLGGGRDGASNVTFDWTPRARKHGAWLDGAEVPAADLPDDFLVTVYTDATYTTEKFQAAAIGASQYVYPVADQTADFGSPQATYYWAVAAYGTLGLGYAARGAT